MRQKQMSFARVLESGALIILADEPTGNLDKANGENAIEIAAAGSPAALLCCGGHP
jgi:ABC-type lipoprotein export system ATPase subunit